MESREIFLGSLEINSDIIKPYLCNSFDEDGKAYIRDSYDFNNNMIIKRVGKNILTGNEEWRYDTETQTFCYYQANKFNENGFGKYDTMMCTHFRWQTYDKNINESMFQGNESGEIMFCFYKGKYDLTYFKTWLSEQMKQNKPVEVYFALQFPIIMKKEPIYNWNYLERINREFAEISIKSTEGGLDPVMEKNRDRLFQRKV